MNTSYLNMSEKTAMQMLSMLDLFSDCRADERTISLSYTKGEIDFPEPVLNLRWSLFGEWRTIQLVELTQDKNTILKKLEGLLSDSKNASWFFYQATPLKVPGKDFETGIDNLFSLITSSKEISSPAKISLPIFLIKKEYESYDVFCYVSSVKKFSRVEKLGGFFYSIFEHFSYSESGE